MSTGGKVYDHLVLAGASIAAVEKYTNLKSWAETFIEHVGLSIDLHAIDGVMILDHRTCGAFVEFGLIPKEPEVPEEGFEFDQHQLVAREAQQRVGPDAGIHRRRDVDGGRRLRPHMRF